LKPLTPEQIREIAELLDCGYRCYLRKRTGELLSLPGMENNAFEGEEFFSEELEKLENEFNEYIEIERPSSHESFNIMVDFTNQLPDNNALKSRLIEALDRRKPFRDFKYQIDNSGIYRDEWFAFKNAKLQQLVLDAFEAANRSD
jgi:hypothetical protein